MWHPRHVLVLGSLLVSVACGGGGGGGSPGGPVDPPLPFLTLSTFQSAAVAVGQPGPSAFLPDAGGAGPDATGLRSPGGSAGGALFVPDTQNHRVLGFAGVPASDGAAASFVLGQPGFSSNAPGTSASSLREPQKAVVAGGKLFVSDLANHRVLIWDRVPTSNVPADHVLGQASFLGSAPNDDDQDGVPDAAPSARTLWAPVGLAVAAGRLYVVDQNNHRVLIWDRIPTSSFVAADRVLGQLDFVSNGSGTSDYQLSGPADVAVGGGRLFVADTLNHRVLVWNAAPPPFPLADLVLGQASFVSAVPAAGATGMFWPVAVHASSSQLFVADYGNHRVLVFDALPTTIQQAADRVLGQSGFLNVAPNDDDQDGTPDAGPSGRTFSNPTGVAGLGRRLYVTDLGNHRVLVFESP